MRSSFANGLSPRATRLKPSVSHIPQPTLSSSCECGTLSQPRSVCGLGSCTAVTHSWRMWPSTVSCQRRTRTFPAEWSSVTSRVTRELEAIVGTTRDDARSVGEVLKALDHACRGRHTRANTRHRRARCLPNPQTDASSRSCACTATPRTPSSSGSARALSGRNSSRRATSIFSMCDFHFLENPMPQRPSTPD